MTVPSVVQGDDFTVVILIFVLLGLHCVVTVDADLILNLFAQLLEFVSELVFFFIP
jgi:hypothetical protein